MLIAHASHWLVNLLYMAPVAVFLGWLGVTTLRDRGRARRAARAEPQDHKPKQGRR